MREGMLLAIAVTALLTGCLSNGPSAEEKPTPIGELRQVTLKIDGMVCPACPQTIEAALLQLDGVVEADISQEKKGGTVVYDAGKVTAGEIARSKIFSWGVYTAEVMEDRAVEGD